MSHGQAFHTSCRAGLSGTAGFQVNAATADLDRAQLAAMVASHARYDAPRDLPFEPTPEEMRAFPVALRMTVVPDVGPVVSRTAYVGREYRGADGAPDEGRFGNYFCHMIVGQPGGDAFDGLYAAELWDAQHWTTDESPSQSLPALDRLAPGPLERVLEAVATAPDGVAAAVLDGAFKALQDGPPLLIVDPDVSRAATWIGWITFALPASRAGELTFSTFEGRPHDVRDLHAIVTTPSCDGATSGAQITRVDVTQPAGARPSLYARAATQLAAASADALAGAVRQVGDGDLTAAGARLAIAGEVTELVGDDDLGAVLAELLAATAAGEVETASAAAAQIPPAPEADRRHLGAWSELHRAARDASNPAGRELASVALARLTAHIDAPLEELAQVPPSAPTQPTVSGIGSWLRATEAARGTDAVGHLLAVGVRLGLIGLNVVVDERVAAVAAAELDRPGVLATLATSRAACRAMRERAGQERTFAAVAAWEQLRVVAAPAELPAAAAELAGLAQGSREEAAVRGLWGAAGPTTREGLAALVGAYQSADRAVPADDVARAFAALMASPLPTQTPARGDLGHLLTQLPRDVRHRPEYYAWAAGLVAIDDADALDEWARRTVAALAAPNRAIPDERWSELLAIAAERLVTRRRSDGFEAAFARFLDGRFQDFPAMVGAALARELAADADPARLAASEFALWTRLRSPEVDDELLPAAFEPLTKGDREAVAELLGPELARHWEDWSERHPRRGMVARALGRRGRDRHER